MKLRRNRHFALPAPDRDIIMVGPGTGIAPFRAFVQERRATAARGRNWLFFGDRQFTHDFLYQLEWQEALKDGSLTRMDVAFSRDQPEKIYVQDRMWERRRDIVEWLDGGASFYVCGDAKAMAKDVRAALVRAYADVKSVAPDAAEQIVAQLDRDKRLSAGYLLGHGLIMADELSRNERIKEASHHLRGTLSEGLREEITGAISEDDQQLVKFHGMYLQDDRDLRAERGRKKMEKAFSFMLRVRISGGVLKPEQWLALDRVARDYGNGTMRLTTRQTVQLHGVIKSNLKSTMKAIDTALLNTIAACGDVNRNVMCNPNPFQSQAHAGALELARAISDHLTPRTGAYREIWLDGEKIAGGEPEEAEPIYGKTYLPRKFKIAVAVPPSNDVDVFTNDLSFIAIVDDAGAIAGWNVTVGGGMGMTHGEPDTYPRTADLLGFCRTEDAVAVAEAVVTVQRDWGNRSNRKHARLKYTIEDRGLDAFRTEVEKRIGIKLDLARPYQFTSTGDRYGWTEGDSGHGHFTLFVENGRIRDAGNGVQQLSALRRIAEMNVGDIRLTANQNIIIANVPVELRDEITRIAADGGLCRPGRACGAIRWPASRCRPAGWRLPKASAICPN